MKTTKTSKKTATTGATDEKGLMAKSVWHIVDDLGMKINEANPQWTLNFEPIRLEWFKQLAQKYILLCRSRGFEFSTLTSKLLCLKSFSNYIDKAHVSSMSTLDDELIARYLSSLRSNQQRYAYGRELIVFLDTGTDEGWFNYDTYYLKSTRPREPAHTSVNIIPDKVLEQLDEHLHHLPEQVQRMVVVIRTLGLRIGELVALKFDCLHKTKSGYSLKLRNEKFNSDERLPIIDDLAAVIQEQQEYIRKQLGDDFSYLFAGYISPVTGKHNAGCMATSAINRYLNKLAVYQDIKDEDGKVWKFKSHQFRRTVATRMANENVRTYIISRYLRHRSPDMIKHYIALLPEEERKRMEKFRMRARVIDVTGREIKAVNPLDNEVELQWLREKMQPRALSMGFCSRPEILKPCPTANACMSCEHFRLDNTDVPALVAHLERARRLREESERRGFVRQLKGIQADEAKLTQLIQILEA